MLFSFGKSRRRRRIRAAAYPEPWLATLAANVRHFGCLPLDLQTRLADKTRIFVCEKTWVPCNGLVIDDEVRVTIAGQACLLLLGYDEDYCHDRVRSVLVYPGAYLRRRSWFDASPRPVDEGPTSGEAWPKGPIVLSWAQSLSGGLDADRGRNVVLHEFAHHLDDLDGDFDGMPSLGGDRERRCWSEVLRGEYERLADAVRRGEPTLIDPYGASNRVEFFATATECFFMRPQSLRSTHSELYAALAGLFCLDPAAWYTERRLTDDADDEQSQASYRQSVARLLKATRLPSGSADEAFTEGVIHFQNGQTRRAVECFSECLRRDPNDAEAYFQRALAWLESAKPSAALPDLNEAIRLEPDEADYYCARSQAHRRLGNRDLARYDWRQARSWDPRLPAYEE